MNYVFVLEYQRTILGVFETYKLAEDYIKTMEAAQPHREIRLGCEIWYMELNKGHMGDAL